MNIAFLCYEAFQTGGIRVYARELLNRISSLGHRVVLFAPTPRSLSETGLNPQVELRTVNTAGMPLISAPLFGVQLPGLLRKTEKEDGRFDVVHSNAYADALLPRLATKAMRITTVHHLGSSAAQSMRLSILDMLAQPSSEYGPALALEGFCLRRADHIIAVSSFTRNDILEKYRWIDHARVSVVHHGSNPRTLTVDSGSESYLKQAWGLETNDRILLCVGRLERRKGIPFLLKALSNLSSRTDAKLVLVGSGSPELFKPLAKDLGISKRIVYTGYVNEDILNALYAHASVLVHPTAMEGFGLAVADAVDAGIPIVATRVGSIPEIMTEGVDGFLVEYGDSHALADAMSIALMSESAQPMGTRRRRPPRFSWDRTARETISVYERLLLLGRS